MPRFVSSLRFRLFVLILLVFVPAVGLQFYNNREQRLVWTEQAWLFGRQLRGDQRRQHGASRGGCETTPVRDITPAVDFAATTPPLPVRRWLP